MFLGWKKQSSVVDHVGLRLEFVLCGLIPKLSDFIDNKAPHYVTGQQKAWIKWLYLGEHCYNTTCHLSIGMIPFRALYRYDEPSFIDRIFEDNKAPLAKDWICESQDILRVLKENIQVAEN